MKQLCLFCVCLLILAVSGCITAPAYPIVLDKAYFDLNVRTIALMPVVDRRIDKSKEVNFEKALRIPGLKLIQKKKYTVTLVDTFGGGKAFDPAQVKEMSAEELAALTPDGADAMMIIYLEDFASSYLVMSSAFKAEATAGLYSKQHGGEIWRDKGIGRSGSHGLIASGLVLGLDKSAVFYECRKTMFDSLPKMKRR